MATWKAVSGVEISSVLEQLANFLLAKNVGEHINATMQSWLSSDGVVERLKGASDDQLDELLNTQRPNGYWPERLTPTLIELSELLEFLAYRDEIERVKNSEVQSILAQLKAFSAFEGRCHLAATSHHHDTSAFINAMPRHPSEVYSYTPTGHDASNDPNVKYSNMIFDWSREAWFPNVNGEVVFKMGIANLK